MTRPEPAGAGTAEKRCTLFQQGPFTLHGGTESMWKIDCDALTDADWETLAEMALSFLPPFSGVVGVPRGGARLQYALQRANPHGHNHPRLIVDDVLTTGASILALMDRADDIGLVVFARGPLPPRVTALFAMPPAITAAESRAMERCAKIADDHADAWKREGHVMPANAVRTVALEIRSSINPPGEEE